MGKVCRTERGLRWEIDIFSQIFNLLGVVLLELFSYNMRAYSCDTSLQALTLLILLLNSGLRSTLALSQFNLFQSEDPLSVPINAKCRRGAEIRKYSLVGDILYYAPCDRTPARLSTYRNFSPWFFHSFMFLSNGVILLS